MDYLVLCYMHSSFWASSQRPSCSQTCRCPSNSSRTC